VADTIWTPVDIVLGTPPAPAVALDASDDTLLAVTRLSWPTGLPEGDVSEWRVEYDGTNTAWTTSLLISIPRTAKKISMRWRIKTTAEGSPVSSPSAPIDNPHPSGGTALADGMSVDCPRPASRPATDVRLVSSNTATMCDAFWDPNLEQPFAPGAYGAYVWDRPVNVSGWNWVTLVLPNNWPSATLDAIKALQGKSVTVTGSKGTVTRNVTGVRVRPSYRNTQPYTRYRLTTDGLVGQTVGHVRSVAEGMAHGDDLLPVNMLDG